MSSSVTPGQRRHQQRLPGAEVVRGGPLGDAGGTVDRAMGEPAHAGTGEGGDRGVGYPRPTVSFWLGGVAPVVAVLIGTILHYRCRGVVTAERNAVVVGGGTGGLATAAGLLGRGWSVQVLEQADEFAEVGAGISLWANAFTALDVIGLGDRVRALPTMDVSPGLRDRRGRWIVRPSAGDGGDRRGSPVLLHRAELMRALLGGVPPDCLRVGARVHTVRVERGKVVVEHAEGSATADLVVGADGLSSAVRAQVWPDAPPPRYAGFTAWRMVLPAPAATPVPGAESWGRGALFGLLPLSGNRVYCYATGAVPAGGASPDGEVAAATLAMVLADESDVDTALVRYDKLRRPRAQTIVRRSRSAGAVAQLSWPPAIALRNAALRVTPPALFARSLATVLNWRPAV